MLFYSRMEEVSVLMAPVLGQNLILEVLHAGMLPARVPVKHLP